MNIACGICLNLSVKISENYVETHVSCSRFVQADPVLVHLNGYLTEHSQKLLCHCGGHDMGRSDVL